MDQSKFFYPRGGNKEFQSKELGRFMRPKAHISCLIMHGWFILYTISPNDLKKDGSTMADIIMHALHLLRVDFQVDLSKQHFCLQTDNTTRECKNNVIARLMGGLVSHGIFCAQNFWFKV